MTTLCPPPPSSATPSVSSIAVAEILRIRRARASQQQTSTASLLETKSKPRRPLLKKAMSERRLPTSLDMHLSGGGGGGGGGRRSSTRSSLHDAVNKVEEEDDDKSFTSMGSFSSCGSNWTIGSTNSMDDKHRKQYHTRRAMSARNLLGNGDNSDEEDY